MYKRLQEVSKELFEIRNELNVKGKSVGWTFDNLPYTVKEGCTTYIGAAPASGKTEIWFEFLINLSCLHGWRHVIFSPETGSAAEVYAELCYKYIGKPYTIGENSMSQGEQVSAEMFINEHFIVVDPIDEDLTLEKFYLLVDQIERTEAVTINTTTIDPWNELTEEYTKDDLGREDKYLSRILGLARKNARKTKRHNCIINHVRDQAPITQNGHTFYPMPTARDFAGGQVWFRKGLTVLIPWRPPVGLTDNEGNIYEENEVHLKVAKSKPKGVSKNGTYKLYLDVQKYQYYMKDFAGNRIYAMRSIDEQKSNSFPAQNPQKVINLDIVNGKEIMSTSEKLKMQNKDPF
ncbi:MAG: Flavobacterium phage [Bacteroidota bacterium]|jgi:hypothetical protein